MSIIFTFSYFVLCILLTSRHNYCVASVKCKLCFTKKFFCQTLLSNNDIIVILTFTRRYCDLSCLLVSKCVGLLVFLAHSKNELMQWRGVRRLSVCLFVRL